MIYLVNTQKRKQKLRPSQLNNFHLWILSGVETIWTTLQKSRKMILVFEFTLFRSRRFSGTNLDLCLLLVLLLFPLTIIITINNNDDQSPRILGHSRPEITPTILCSRSIHFGWKTSDGVWLVIHPQHPVKVYTCQWKKGWSTQKTKNP